MTSEEIRKLPVRSTEPVVKCGKYLRKSCFGQLRHYCPRPTTHVVAEADGRIVAHGCEVHARQELRNYKDHSLKVRPLCGSMVREQRVDGWITYRECE
jgi:hypothetical protein